MALEDFDLLRQKFNLPRATGIVLSQSSGVDTSSYFQRFTFPSEIVYDEERKKESPGEIGAISSFSLPPSQTRLANSNIQALS